MLIRQAKRTDGASIIRLMHQLADFEGYLNEFVVTQKDLDERLFNRQDFHVLVAESENQIGGILVYYYLPFTFDLKPWIYVKELIVDSKHRGLGLGKALMQSLAKEALANDCSKIRWDVLTNNHKAKSFYQSLGAQHDEQWQLFSLTGEQLKQLVS